MCACVRACIVCMCARARAHLRRVRVRARARVCVCVCECVCACACMRVGVCLCLCLRLCVERTQSSWVGRAGGGRFAGNSNPTLGLPRSPNRGSVVNF